MASLIHLVVSRTGRTEYQLLLMKASDRGRNVKFLGNNFGCFGCVLSKLSNRQTDRFAISISRVSMLTRDKKTVTGYHYKLIYPSAFYYTLNTH